MARGPQRGDGARGGNVGAPDRGEKRLAVLHAGPSAARFEGSVVRPRRRERVRLVLEAADCDACHALCYAPVASFSRGDSRMRALLALVALAAAFPLSAQDKVLRIVPHSN